MDLGRISGMFGSMLSEEEDKEGYSTAFSGAIQVSSCWQLSQGEDLSAVVPAQGGA